MVSDSHDIKEGSLADFLRAKRARLQPKDVGLSDGRRRRTPGLRREELADLAGVGVSWYTALEQGRDINPSDHLLRSLAVALKLTPAEAQHLFFLSGRHPPAEFVVSSKTVSPGLRTMVELLNPRPALIANKQWDWLVWNDAADIFFETDSDALDGGHARNTLWQTFKGKRTMPDADWEAYARLLVGRLRASPHFSSQNDWFKDLVRQLMDESEDFRRVWNRYEVADIFEARQIVHHSEFGRVSAEVLTFTIPAMIDAWLVVFLVDHDVADRLAAKIGTTSPHRRKRGAAKKASR